MLVGLLVVFYPDKAQHAAKELKQLMETLAPQDNKLLAVNISSREFSVNHADNTYYLPAPELWEFSGWGHLLSKLNDADLEIIFANDTFCHHRPWTAVERSLFVSSISKARATKRSAIAGEVCSLGENFRIEQLSSKHWISSYLFYVNRTFYYDIIPEYFSKLSSFTSDVKCRNGSLEFTDNISGNLARTLTSWLNPNNPKSWRPLEKNNFLFENKAKVILCEMYLSFFADERNALLLDVYGPWWTPKGLWRSLSRRILK